MTPARIAEIEAECADLQALWGPGDGGIAIIRELLSEVRKLREAHASVAVEHMAAGLVADHHREAPQEKTSLKTPEPEPPSKDYPRASSSAAGTVAPGAENTGQSFVRRDCIPDVSGMVPRIESGEAEVPK